MFIHIGFYYLSGKNRDFSLWHDKIVIIWDYLRPERANYPRENRRMPELIDYDFLRPNRGVAKKKVKIFFYIYFKFLIISVLIKTICI